MKIALVGEWRSFVVAGMITMIVAAFASGRILRPLGSLTDLARGVASTGARRS